MKQVIWYFGIISLAIGTAFGEAKVEAEPLQLAQNLIKRGLFNRALVVLTKVADEKSGDTATKAQILLARIWLDPLNPQRSPYKALQALKAALKNRPLPNLRAEIYLLMGIAYGEVGKINDARRAFRSVYTGNGYPARWRDDGYFWAGVLEVQKGNRIKAIQLLESLLQEANEANDDLYHNRQSLEDETRIWLAKEYMAKNDWQRVISTLRPLVDNLPGSPYYLGALIMLIEGYARVGDELNKEKYLALLRCKNADWATLLFSALPRTPPVKERLTNTPTKSLRKSK